jgi:hypothetical protein
VETLLGRPVEPEEHISVLAQKSAGVYERLGYPRPIKCALQVPEP